MTNFGLNWKFFGQKMGIFSWFWPHFAYIKVKGFCGLPPPPYGLNVISKKSWKHFFEFCPQKFFLGLFFKKMAKKSVFWWFFWSFFLKKHEISQRLASIWARYDIEFQNICLSKNLCKDQPLFWLNAEKFCVFFKKWPKN